VELGSGCIEKFAVIWWRGETAISRARPPASPGDMTIITRKDALAQGLTHYFTGNACKHGHIAIRYAKTGQCSECLSQRSRRPDIKLQVVAKTKTEEFQKRRRDYHRHYYKRKNPVRRIFHKSKIHAKIASNLRNRINLALRGKNKSESTMRLLGCTIPELFAHLESQFSAGMSWDNHGKHGWHIDHIRPCASFDFSDPEQQQQCFHYSNLQPLWAGDNLSKGSALAL
jgi:hypothetical protein